MPPNAMTPEDAETWISRSDLVQVKARIVGVFVHDGIFKEVELGTIVGEINKKPGANYNFHAGAKMKDPTLTGWKAHTRFVAGLNLTAVGSKHW